MRSHSLLLLALIGAAQSGCSPLLSATKVQPAPASPSLASASSVRSQPHTSALHNEQRPQTSHRATDNAASEAAIPPAPLDALTKLAEGAPQPVAAQVQIEVERPYKHYQRARPEGAILAAGEDEKLARWNVGGTGDPNFVSNRPDYHPGARVVVNTKLVAGSLPKRSSRQLSQQSLLAQSRSKGYWPLRICYENAVRRDPEQSGKTVVRLTIARSGRVTRARLLTTELDRKAGDCLSDAVGGLRFGAGPGAGMVAVDLSVEFWPGDAPVPSVDAPEDYDDNPGTLDTEDVTLAVDSVLPEVRRCYAEGLRRDAALWGRLQLLVEVSPEGETRSVTQTESRFPNPQVSECIIEALKGVSFPAPAQGSLTFIQAFRLGHAQPRAPIGLPASCQQ